MISTTIDCCFYEEETSHISLNNNLHNVAASIVEVLILVYDQDGTINLEDLTMMTTVYLLAPAEFNVKLTMKLQTNISECKTRNLEVGPCVE